MKKTVRIIAFILALMMVLPLFVACNNDPQKDNNEAQTTGTDTGGQEVVEGLPDMNWDGREYRILATESTTDWKHNFEVWREELPDDVVGRAVYNRNKAISDKYGITVTGYLVSGANNKAKTMLEAGDDNYDLLVLPPENHHPFAQEGYLLDMYNLDYVNTDAKGWQAYANKQLTMGGRLYYTTNKFLIQDKNRSWSVFYNRDMAKELNLGYFEDYVFDGTWTIDKVTELAKLATYEKDGENGLGKFDNWGAAASENYMFCQLAYGVGFRLTDHGADGYPVLVGPTDDMVARLDKVFNLVTDTTAYYCDERMLGSVDWADCADQMFHRGDVLICYTVLSELQTVGEKINFEMGVLPNPKFDERQEAYYSIPNLGNGSLLGVPVTVPDREFAGYALEAISELSVDTTYVAVIETTCKLQKVQDDDAARCLSLIYDGIAYDIGFVSNIGGLGKMLWTSIASANSNLYNRVYSRIEAAANIAIDKVREDYKAIANEQN
jgi:hypothetical protein